MSDHSKLTADQQSVIEQVQYNCDISDANHAGNYTLCIYLLKMREYYRWLHALEFSDEFDGEAMSQWLRDKEETWDTVIDQEYRSIKLHERQFDAFDNVAINAELQQHDLFYHAGIGGKGIQHFFVADKIANYQQDGIDITITGQEYARDLTAPPAMSTQNEIIVRQQSLKRMCWERYQEWHWNQYSNPMGQALAFYPFDDSISLALQLMVETEQNTLIQHELGEMQITLEFADQWPAMMLGLLGSKAELLARSVRDHLADCLTTLPYLIEHNNPASLHFYFANLTYMRKELFPSAVAAYQHWSESGKTDALHDLTHSAADHWHKTLQSILAVAAQNPQNPAPSIVELIEHSRF
jgi:hypothetical protein